MADCGASGSALDRALSSLVTSPSNRLTGESLDKLTKAVSGLVSGIACTGNTVPSRTIMSTESIGIAAPTESIINCADRMGLYPTIHETSYQWTQTSNPCTFGSYPYSGLSHSRTRPSLTSELILHPYPNINHEQILRQQILNGMIQKNMSIIHASNSTIGNSFSNSTKVSSETANTLTEDCNDGLARDVTVEELMAAWQEAETEYFSDAYDLQNLAEQYTEDTNSIGPISGISSSYEFSETSRLYGLPSIANIEMMSDPQSMHHKPLINLMEKGLELFHQGEISEAILCFESHLQNVDLDDSDAWLMLGKCHAESDEDRKAIGCLERSLAKNPNSSSALLALGVSCVNELLHERALLHLKNWIIRHPKYTNMMKTSIPQSIDGSSESLALDELKQMLKLALDSDTSSDAPKCADVLEAMGILCNVSREYDDAANYFREALHQRNDDHQLWNKLGATLANSNHSDDALHAYREALSLKPKYARAWLNMAIAHSNLQNHEEAARCYLQTLSLNSLATHVWNYLRISLTALERWDLMPLIAARDIHQFHNHFDFVEF